MTPEELAPAARLISINEAAAKGVNRVRKPVWANPCDHLFIDIIDGRPGPWLHLFSPLNKEFNGRDPVTLSPGEQDYASPEFVPHTGPTAGSDEYKKQAADVRGVAS